MAAQSKNAMYRSLAGNFRFRVFIEKHELAFSRISGLSLGIEREIYAEGGAGRYAHYMRTPDTQARSVTMERGMQVDGADIIEKLVPGMYIQTAQILVLDKRRNISCEYNPEELWVNRWEISEMEGLGSRLMLDIFELEYLRLSRRYYG